jgi:hypothetical protein
VGLIQAGSTGIALSAAICTSLHPRPSSRIGNTCGMRLRTGDPTLLDDLRAHFDRSGFAVGSTGDADLKVQPKRLGIEPAAAGADEGRAPKCGPSRCVSYGR